MKRETVISPWLRFYRCPECGAADEKAGLRDPTGPCPKCGADNLQFVIGRWHTDWAEPRWWHDLIGRLNDPIFTVEFRSERRA